VRRFFEKAGVPDKSLEQCITRSRANSSEVLAGNFRIHCRYAELGDRVAYEVFAEPQESNVSTGQPDRRAFAVPGTDHVIVLGDDQRQLTVAVAQPLLDAISRWLATEFELPSTRSLPRIEIVPPARINDMRYGRLLPGAGPTESMTSRAQGDVMAVYSDAAHTIYLPEGWTGSTAADLSVLVHEMVHHLQNAAALKYACPQEREALAYRAQERWLGLFGRSLAQDFQIDGFSLLAKTRCLY